MTDIAQSAAAMSAQPRHLRPYANVVQTIGWTPLIRLNATARGIRTPVYGKAEFMNPGGSITCRIGPAIIGATDR